MNSTLQSRLRAVPVLCYVLLAGVWVLDLFTPQSFVAAILMNGPIAMSSVVLRRGLTVRLVVFAEIANAIACYINGAQSNFQWDAIAVGNRALLAASYLLVGYMSAQTQSLAREAGAASLRRLQMRSERALRGAIDRVRANLSRDLVMRAVVREALNLCDADRAFVFTRSSLLVQPEMLDANRGSSEVAVHRESLPVEAASVINRLTADEPVQRVRADDAAGRLLLDRWRVTQLLVARLPWDAGEETLLFVLPPRDRAVDDTVYDTFAAFAQQAGLALSQSALFERLATRNDEIADRNRIIRDIVYALAHDLRTPLSAANTTMKQALAGAYGDLPDAYRSILRATVASNDDLRNLAETLLMVARYELGDVSKAPEPVDLSALCVSVVGEMVPVAFERGIAFELHDSTGGGARVLADTGEVRRAMLNLIANAFSATPEHGHVNVLLGRRESQIVVDIEDDGYGVPDARRESLFERFGTSSVASGGGSGLGLYIVRRIAEKHGGSASFRPLEPRGSAFSITLPELEAS